MGYVLSVIHPPVAPAAFGNAVVLDPVGTKEALQRRVEYVLMTEAGADKGSAMAFGLTVTTSNPGWEIAEGSSGLVFRFDPADDAPHPCPCCGRLVLPTDHAYAHDPDAYCLGCWADSVNPGCLPANTAHTEAP